MEVVLGSVRHLVLMVAKEHARDVKEVAKMGVRLHVEVDVAKDVKEDVLSYAKTIVLLVVKLDAH